MTKSKDLSKLIKENSIEVYNMEQKIDKLRSTSSKPKQIQKIQEQIKEQRLNFSKEAYEIAREAYGSKSDIKDKRAAQEALMQVCMISEAYKSKGDNSFDGIHEKAIDLLNKYRK